MLTSCMAGVDKRGNRYLLEATKKGIRCWDGSFIASAVLLYMH